MRKHAVSPQQYNYRKTKLDKAREWVNPLTVCFMIGVTDGGFFTPAQKEAVQ